MEIDVREHAEVPLEGERILTDEKALVTLEPEHAIAGACAHEAGVGGDAHQRRIEVHGRLGVPAGLEGGRERQAVVTDLNGRNLMSGCRRRALEMCAHGTVAGQSREIHYLHRKKALERRGPLARRLSLCEYGAARARRRRVAEGWKS